MRERETARVILLDPSDRLLLVAAVDGIVRDPEGGRLPGTRYWLTPGGGIEPGESVVEAAQRELLEETGLADVEIGPVVWAGEQTLLYRDEPVHQRECFVIARTTATKLSSSGWQEEERASLTALRWWTAAELRDTRERILPSLLTRRADELGTLFERARRAPSLPIARIDLR